MSDLITYTHCPACSSDDIKPLLTAKDYTVSGESFAIWHCAACTLRFTQDVPAIHVIGRYYQSAAYVSHSDTDKGLVNRLYHIVRNITLQSKRKLVQRVSGQSSGSILDVGAGTGAFSNTMQQAGWQVTALEPDDTARQNARKRYALTLQSPDTLFELQPAQFDVITMWHVLEHVHDLHGYLQQFHSVLKPGGRLMIAVPNYTSYDAAIYQNYWAAYDVPRHLYHFSPQSIQLLGKAKGFSLLKVKPMWFDSFYVSMLSEQYRNGKGNIIRAFLNGLLSNLKAAGNARNCSSVIYIFGKE